MQSVRNPTMFAIARFFVAFMASLWIFVGVAHAQPAPQTPRLRLSDDLLAPTPDLGPTAPAANRRLAPPSTDAVPGPVNRACIRLDSPMNPATKAETGRL